MIKSQAKEKGKERGGKEGGEEGEKGTVENFSPPAA
jgi:hypothetical protein